MVPFVKRVYITMLQMSQTRTPRQQHHQIDTTNTPKIETQQTR